MITSINNTHRNAPVIFENADAFIAAAIAAAVAVL